MPILLPLLASSLLIGVWSCNPSASPGAETPYAHGLFSMKIAPTTKWIHKGLPPISTTIGAQLAKMINDITEELKLPHDTVTVSVDKTTTTPLEVETPDTSFAISDCIKNKQTPAETDQNPVYGVDSNYVFSCTYTETWVPKYLSATVSGHIESAMAATQSQWDYLAYKLQEAIKSGGYATIDGVIAIEKDSSST